MTPQPKFSGPLDFHETLDPVPVISSGVLKLATLTLTDAQITTLRTTPVTIVPAPGANKAIVCVFAALKSSIVTPYTNLSSAAGDACLQVWNGAGGGFELAPLPQNPGGRLNDFLTQDTNVVIPVAAAYDSFWGVIPYNTSIPANNNNLPVIVQLLNSLGNLTGGNAANTLKITLAYMELDQS